MSMCGGLADAFLSPFLSFLNCLAQLSSTPGGHFHSTTAAVDAAGAARCYCPDCCWRCTTCAPLAVHIEPELTPTKPIVVLAFKKKRKKNDINLTGTNGLKSYPMPELPGFLEFSEYGLYFFPFLCFLLGYLYSRFLVVLFLCFFPANYT